MKIVFLTFIYFLSIDANAYKIEIYTDEISNTKSLEVIDLFKKTYPFNQYEIEFSIKTVKENVLDCKIDKSIERNMACNSKEIATDAAKRGINQVFIIKEASMYAGSGGGIPVITNKSDARTLLHEYMHTIGFSDEYQYSSGEVEYYCKESGANMAIFEPNPNGYSSDSEAKVFHSRDIPWNDSILLTTPITHDGTTLQLGTGIVHHQIFSLINTRDIKTKMGSAIGLYEGKTCKHATPPKKTWQPGSESTIMENLEAGLGAGNEYMVDKILTSRGLKRIKATNEFKYESSIYDQSRDLIEKLEHDSSIQIHQKGISK